MHFFFHLRRVKVNIDLMAQINQAGYLVQYECLGQCRKRINDKGDFHSDFTAC
jgi:hypothetical protein